jgi:hypothetical protein
MVDTDRIAHAGSRPQPCRVQFRSATHGSRLDHGVRDMIRTAPLSLVTALAAVGFTVPAAALPFIPPVATAGAAGSLGVGGQATMEILPWLNGRLAVQGLGYSHSFSKDNTPYDAHLGLLSYGGLLDLYPLTHGPRLSVGLMGNSNKVTMHANCANGCTANNDRVTGANANFDGDMTFSKAAPYAGLGWGNSMVGSPIYISGDLGVLFQGAAKVSLDASGEAMVSSNGGPPKQVNLATDASFQQQLHQETNNLVNQVKTYQYYPVAMLTIGWRF